MRRGVANQVIGAQLVSADDGTPVTSGTVTVSVTIDGGTQAAGTGTVTHKGGGYWSYAPTAGETNGWHVAYSFAHASAVPVTVQVYTTYPQSGDSFGLLGGMLEPSGAVYKYTADALSNAPSGGGGGATPAQIAEAVWDEPLAGHTASGSAGAALSAASSAGDPWATALPGGYAAGTAGYIIGNRLDADVSTRLAASAYTAPLSAAGTRAAVGLASANLDVQLDALPTVAELSERTLPSAQYATSAGIGDVRMDIAALDIDLGAVSVQVSGVASDIAGLNDVSVSDILSAPVEGSYTLSGMLRIIGASAAGALTGAATNEVTIRALGGMAERIVATVDEDGNRLSVTLDAG